MISTRTICAEARVRSGGLTLIELVVSVAITSILTIALGSTILIASRALPDGQGPAEAAVRAAAVADQLSGELQYAISINSRSANMVEFTVADRNGDEAPETIRYEWSGAAGDPLTRQYNGGAVAEILDNVREFHLEYDLKEISEEVAVENESGETTLAFFGGGGNLASRSVTAGKWYGQYFKPLLPGDAVSWKVTRVQFYAKTGGASSGRAKVQLRIPTARKWPSALILEEKTLLESTLLNYYLKQEFTFSVVSGLSPDRGLCLVIEHVSDSEACKVLIEDSGFYSPRSNLVKTADAGLSWSAPSGQSMLLWVYGTITTAGEPTVQVTRYLQGAQIRLEVGDDAGPPVRTGATMVNAPQVIE